MGDLARTKYAGGVRIDHHLDHHARVKRLVARSTTCVARMKGAQLQAVHRIIDEVRQVTPPNESPSQSHHALLAATALTSA